MISSNEILVYSSARLRSLYCGMFLLMMPFLGLAQDISNEQVKRVQRAIYIYNLAHQLEWPNASEEDTFKIGILGPDRTAIDLKSMALKRNIQKKRVEILRFDKVRDVQDIDLLYVNNKFNFDVNYILNKIRNQNTLLITEDYEYNSSMINMVNVGTSFEYEINEGLLKQERFLVSPSLKRYAVSNSERWKELFKIAEDSLETARKKEEQQTTEIQKQAETIASQEEVIDTIEASVTDLDNWIKELSTENEIQKQLFEDKELIEKGLEDNIARQVKFIKDQQAEIEASSSKIEAQREVLAKQQEAIDAKNAVLKEKDSQVKRQKTINLLLLALLLLGAVAAVTIYKNYLAKKRLTQELRDKQEAVELQAIALQSKNKELEQFAYIASHDLKEPLITISSLIGLLIEDYEDKLESDALENLNYIDDSCNRLRKLIDALLDYTRLGGAKEFKTVDCNKTVNQLQTDLQNVIERSNATVEVANLPKVRGAETELRLLFQNLIVNGIKFTAPDTNPKVKVNCKKSDTYSDFWEFSVTDNGIGIAEAYKERVFSIFQRLHSQDDYEGTGIGLAHCKKIVEGHGGTIWLESQEGVGTTFFFTLPVN